MPRAAITNGLARNNKLNCEGHTSQGMGIKHGPAVQLMPSLVHTIHTPGVHAPIRLRPVEVDYDPTRQCEYPGQGLMKLKHQGMQCETVCGKALMWTSPVQPLALHCKGCCAEQAGRKAQGEHSHVDPAPCQQPRPATGSVAQLGSQTQPMHRPAMCLLAQPSSQTQPMQLLCKQVAATAARCVSIHTVHTAKGGRSHTSHG